ncbi:MAG: hypothetical protein HQK49_04360 [Oligoflexia bacterium]|nr:hypothetical protein [Oligoflexia bacterium]
MSKNYSDIFTAKAYARANIIGGHTDYNQGLVLSALVAESTTVSVKLTQSNSNSENGKPLLVVARSNAFGAVISYNLGEEELSGNWGDYIKGVTKILRKENFKLAGMEIKIESFVPLSSGLCSGVVLMVALMRALKQAFKLDLSDLTISKLILRVQIEFLSMSASIADPMVVSIACDKYDKYKYVTEVISVGDAPDVVDVADDEDDDNERAFFIDTKTLEFERIKLPKEMEILVMNMGRGHSKRGEINICRRRECEEICALLKVNSLRDLQIERIAEYEKFLANKTLFKRARHLLNENIRVLKMRQAFLEGDCDLAGNLMYLSHSSLSSDYEASTAQIDSYLELFKKHKDVYGARLATDSGVASLIVALVRKGQKEKISKEIDANTIVINHNNHNNHINHKRKI